MDLSKKLFVFVVIISILIFFSCVSPVTEEEEEEEDPNINRIIFTIDGTEHTFKYSSSPYYGAYGYFVAEDLPSIPNQYNMIGAISSLDYQNQMNTIVISFVEDDPGIWDLIIQYFMSGSGDFYRFDVDAINLNLLINRDTIGAQMTFNYAGPITSTDNFHTITNIVCSVERKF